MLDDYMRDRLKIGRVYCEFINKEQFREYCRDRLKGNIFYHVVTLNPEMVVLCEKNDSFRKAVAKADIRIPDGAGLIWARWYLRSSFWPLIPSLFAFFFQEIERVTGVESVFVLAGLCEEDKIPVYLLGGTRNQNQLTANRLRRKYKRLIVYESISHNYEIGGGENIIKDIQDKKPGVILVAYGAPKQTLWIESVKRKLPGVKVAMGVGGAFAIISEERPRAPKLFRKINIEWLWRLYLEPKRARRIWTAVVSFSLLVRKQKRNFDA